MTADPMPLTDVELEILELLADGLTLPAIAHLAHQRGLLS